MNLFVLSDLHIWGPDDPFYLSLLSLLRSRAQPGDQVILAGDIFDLFVGNKKLYRKRYERFFQEAQAAEMRGVGVQYIEGNHDFLFPSKPRTDFKMKVHAAEIQLEFQGKKFFVAHGDLVDRTDYGYRILRFFFRSPLMKALVWICPEIWLDWIGTRWSQRSRKSRPAVVAELSLNKMEKLRRIYRSYAAEKLAQGFDFVILGHCHDLDEMFFNIGGRQGQYINMGYPRMHGSFLSWTSGEEKVHREPFLGPA